MTQIAGFTPTRARAINAAVAFLERNGYNTNRGRKRGYRQPVDNVIGLEFQVVGGVTLQVRVNGGDWQTVMTLRQRVQGTSVQHSIDPAGTPTYVEWETVTDCPTPP